MRHWTLLAAVIVLAVLLPPAPVAADSAGAADGLTSRVFNLK